MSLIGIRNILAPFQHRIQIVSLVIVTVLVGVIRVVTTAGPAAQRSGREPPGTYEESSFGDADSTNSKIEKLLGRSPQQPAVARKASKGRVSDPLLDEAFSVPETRRAPTRAAPSQGGSAGGFDEVKKQLGL